MYFEQRMSTHEIAKVLRISQFTVRELFAKNDITVRSRQEIAEVKRIDRFWTKVRTTDGCWLWNGAKTAGGYGSVTINKKSSLAHRVSYELCAGKIPDGLHIDHLCRVRHCVNPSHLEPVTPKTNCLRGEGPASINSKKKSCSRGHRFSEDNTYITPDGRRNCKTCQRNASHRFMAASKELVTCLQ